ncbi:MAG: hypothetical protein AB7P21_23025 [Lautropia sp.]
MKIENTSDRRFVVAQGEPVGAIVARKDAMLGMQQMSEMIGIDGIDVIGQLPADVQPRSSARPASIRPERRPGRTTASGRLRSRSPRPTKAGSVRSDRSAGAAVHCPAQRPQIIITTRRPDARNDRPRMVRSDVGRAWRLPILTILRATSRGRMRST